MAANASALSLTVPAVPNSELARTFGVLLLGFIFTVTLYGLTFFQTYVYYTHFPGDERRTKYTVALLWALDTAVTTLLSHTIYHYLITDFMIPFTHLITTRTFIAELALSSSLALVVQCYYAFRVWAVSHRRMVAPAVIIALSLASFAFNIVGVAKIMRESLFFRIGDSGIRLMKRIGTGLSVASDLLITCSMFWYLRPRRNPGMAVPEGWYEKIVVYAINRGTCFTVFHVVLLISLLTMPTQQVWILFHWVGNKIYVNSVFSMLNFRRTHHGRGVPEEASLNQRARVTGGRTGGTFITRSGFSGAGAADTSRSVQFNVHADTKSAGPMNIELDMVRSEGDVGFDDVNSDDTKRTRRESALSGGPSKPQDFVHAL
ncbi:hypothetical protein BD414DRAFT_536935 [Trametes punicea]|nr:hypothetical protein BD414DRAFT_536935 [Trametes punicea]